MYYVQMNLTPTVLLSKQAIKNKPFIFDKVFKYTLYQTKTQLNDAQIQNLIYRTIKKNDYR